MIRAENLWKTFGRHEALRGLSFTVPEGSAYALIGANGAGKTTTIRILLNILEAERGANRLRFGKPGHAAKDDGGRIPRLPAALLSAMG